ncbi:MAG: 3-hydroxyacyl-CoA dehydrogenase family protein, partial [Syntrophothermus sp.]
MNDTMNIGIVGAGTMGSGIAALCAIKGYKVVLYDIEQAAVSKAEDKIEKIFSRQKDHSAGETAFYAQAAEQIKYATDISELGDCSLIIEAVFEDLDTKKSIFSRLESFVPAETVLATNTSSL